MSYKIEDSAFKESLKTTNTKQHFGCIITKNNKIVSRGHNFRSFGTSHTCCCHAEMDAVYRHLRSLDLWRDFKNILQIAYHTTGVLSRVASGDLTNHKLNKMMSTLSRICSIRNLAKTHRRQKFKLYIYRFYVDGTVSNAKPCAECSRWLKLVSCLGIHYEVFYSDGNSMKKYQYECDHLYLPSNTYF